MSTASAQLVGELRIGVEMMRTRARRLSKDADELRRLAAQTLEVADQLDHVLLERAPEERKTA